MENTSESECGRWIPLTDMFRYSCLDILLKQQEEKPNKENLSIGESSPEEGGVGKRAEASHISSLFGSYYFSLSLFLPLQSY